MSEATFEPDDEPPIPGDVLTYNTTWRFGYEYSVDRGLTMEAMWSLPCVVVLIAVWGQRHTGRGRMFSAYALTRGCVIKGTIWHHTR